MDLNDFEDVINSDLDTNEFEEENEILEPLLSELDFITDPGIKNFTRSILLKSGPFWAIPVYPDEEIYPPDEYGMGGNVIHTKRVFRTTLLLAHSFQLNPRERDIALAAALLHAVTKAKFTQDLDSVNFDPMYPYTVGFLVNLAVKEDEIHATESHSNALDLDAEDIELILRLIRKQLGSHSPIPETVPKPFSYDNILHLATSVAMNIHLIIDGDDVKEERWKLDE